MAKSTIDLGSADHLQHLASLIIDRAFPKDTDMTVEKLMKEIETVVKGIVGGRK